jgi:hypothetical protein
MSDLIPTQPTDPAEPAQEPKEADVDWKAKSREWERRAKENKGAADELAALKDSQKTSEQKFEERLAEMERRAAEAEAKALRSDIAAKYGLSADDRDLFLTGSDESTLIAQAQRLAGREEDRKKQGNYAPKEGTTPPGSSNTDEREFVRNLFSRAD